MTDDFPETQPFGRGDAPPLFPQQDKIELKSNAKGEIQAEVRIGGDCTTKEAIDDLIERQEHAWKKLKEKFSNLKIKEEEK